MSKSPHPSSSLSASFLLSRSIRTVEQRWPETELSAQTVLWPPHRPEPTAHDATDTGTTPASPRVTQWVSAARQHCTGGHNAGKTSNAGIKLMNHKRKKEPVEPHDLLVCWHFWNCEITSKSIYNLVFISMPHTNLFGSTALLSGNTFLPRHSPLHGHGPLNDPLRLSDSRQCADNIAECERSRPLSALWL